MDDEKVESVTVSERINGWWITVRHPSGHEEHHGPYPDKQRAQTEADLLADQPERCSDC